MPAHQTIVDTPTAICRLGIAWGDITPPVGMYHRMWGATLHDRAEGVHQPLRATAVVFRPAESQSVVSSVQVLVALDHCLLAAQEVDSLQRAIAARTGIQVDSVVARVRRSNLGFWFLRASKNKKNQV